MTDEVGKQGIEKNLESFLKGTDGYTKSSQTPNGFEVQPDSGRDPVPGTMLFDARRLSQAVRGAVAR